MNKEQVPGTSKDDEVSLPKVRRWNAKFKLDLKKQVPKTPPSKPSVLSGRYQANPETLKELSPSKPKQGQNTLPGYFTPASGTGTRSSLFGLTGNRQKPTTIKDLLAVTHPVQVDWKMTMSVMYLQDYMDSHPNIFKNRRRMVLADATGIVNAYIMKEDTVSFNEGDTISINNFKFAEKVILLKEHSDMIRSVYL